MGSTALLQRLAIIQEHGGQEVDSQGDAFFAVFPSALEQSVFKGLRKAGVPQQ